MDNPSAIIDAAVAVFGYLDLAIRLFGLLALVAIVLGAFAGVTQALWRFGLALFGKKILVVAGEDDYRDIGDVQFLSQIEGGVTKSGAR